MRKRRNEISHDRMLPRRLPDRRMCRCPHVSSSGYYAWKDRSLSRRTQDNQRLAERIKTLHEGNNGVMGSPRIWKEVPYGGERCGLNRVARLMHQQGLKGIPQRKRWRKKGCGQRPENVRNHLSATLPQVSPTPGGSRTLLMSGRRKAGFICAWSWIFTRHRGRLVDEPLPGSATGATGHTHGAVAM